MAGGKPVLHLADQLCVGSRFARPDGQARQGLDQVAAAHDAHQPAKIDDGDAPDPVLVQHDGDRFERQPHARTLGACEPPPDDVVREPLKARLLGV